MKIPALNINNRRVCKIKNIDNKEYSVTMFFHSKVTEDQIVDLMKAFAQADKVSFLFFGWTSLLV